MEKLFVLLIAFQLKHFLADFPLQGKYMLGKFKADWSFFWPLFSHCSVHACFTLLICSFFTDIKTAFLLAVMDLIIHFTMDRIKAGPKYLGRFKDVMDKKFWWSLGFDQMVHHLTHYLIIYLILTK